eukprot:356432-Prymnesium_polylepis.1
MVSSALSPPVRPSAVPSVSVRRAVSWAAVITLMAALSVAQVATSDSAVSLRSDDRTKIEQ